jgi:List-Bact-rpt repeat protein
VSITNNDNPLYFTVTNANPGIVGSFQLLPTGQTALTVLINGHGQVTKSPRANRYEKTQTVALTAIADADQSFLGWSGDASGTQTNVTVRMNQSRVVTANFTARPRLSLEPCGGGWTPDGFRLTLTGDFGVRYEIQRSSNGVNWAPWSAITNVFGLTSVLDATPVPGQRFYRAVRP